MVRLNLNFNIPMYHIFQENWQSLNFKDAKTLINDYFYQSGCVPNDHIIFSLLKLKAASLELLETRSRSFAFRIFQTDEVFWFFSGTKKYLYFDSSNGYFSFEKKDSLIRCFNKKNPKFALRAFPDGYYKIFHLYDPGFTCYFFKSTCQDILPKSISIDDKLKKKVFAFARAYGLD